MSPRLPDRRQFLGQSAAWLAAAAALDHDLFAAPAAARISGRQLQLANGLVEAIWITAPGGLRLQQVRDLRRGRKLDGTGPVALLTISGAAVDITSLPVTNIRRSSLAPRPNAANFAERLPGQQLSATLRDPAGRFEILWQALLRQGSHYIRQQITITAQSSDLPLQQVVLLDLTHPGLAVQGTVKGSPVSTSGGWFFGFEHPLSQSTLAHGRAQCALSHPLPLRAGQSAVYSSVVGAFSQGQLRRDFLAYLERERAHPYRPFLHYNSWFDLGYFTPYDQAGCLDVIAAFGAELAHKRRVQLSSFLFDDGWDNHKDWGFNSGFPDGFTPLKAATASLGAGPGVWLSPWGGYGKPRQERLANGRALGYEINRGGLALSGPVYYKVFHQACVDMVARYGINQVKLDGTGSTAEVVPGSA
ncbi:MAG: enterotoxin, partial [Terriglobales bacterium]